MRLHDFGDCSSSSWKMYVCDAALALVGVLQLVTTVFEICSCGCGGGGGGGADDDQAGDQNELTRRRERTAERTKADYMAGLLDSGSEFGSESDQSEDRLRQRRAPSARVGATRSSSEFENSDDEHFGRRSR